MEKEFYMVPVVAGVVLKRDNRFLLVQEGKLEVRGLWNLPAGKVDVGDTVEQTAIKEAREESGFDVKLIRKIDILQEAPSRAVAHIFEAEIIGGELTFPPGEILDARWFSLEEIRNIKIQLRAAWVLEAVERVSDNR